jgi:hypothetical protein
MLYEGYCGKKKKQWKFYTADWINPSAEIYTYFVLIWQQQQKKRS